MRYFSATILLLILAGPHLFAQGLCDELEQLYRLDLLPRYRENTHVGQFSS